MVVYAKKKENLMQYKYTMVIWLLSGTSYNYVMYNKVMVDLDCRF